MSNQEKDITEIDQLTEVFENAFEATDSLEYWKVKTGIIGGKVQFDYGDTTLNLKEDEVITTFQSRFGREEWVKPYTDFTLKEWSAQGISRVDVISPAFSADCLETLEELEVENREFFTEAGGKEYHYILSKLNQLVEFQKEKI